MPMLPSSGTLVTAVFSCLRFHQYRATVQCFLMVRCSGGYRNTLLDQYYLHWLLVELEIVLPKELIVPPPSSPLSQDFSRPRG